MNNTSSQQLHGWRKWVGIALLVLGGISFFLAQSATWMSTTIFNQRSFVDITTSVIRTEESRNAIASIIVDEALADRPVVKRLVGTQVQNLLSGFLASDLTANLYDRVVNGAYAYLTSSNREDIAIDLTGIKTPLSGIVSFAENRGTDVTFDPSNIPDQIVIVSTNDVPDLSSYVRLTLILNFVFWFLTFVNSFFIQASGKIRRSYQVGWVIIGVAVLGLLAGPVFLPPITASFISMIQARDLVSDIATAFLAPFGAQMWVTIVIAGAAMGILALRRHIAKGSKKLVELVATKSTKPAAKPAATKTPATRTTKKATRNTKRQAKR